MTCNVIMQTNPEVTCPSLPSGSMSRTGRGEEVVTVSYKLVLLPLRNWPRRRVASFQTTSLCAHTLNASTEGFSSNSQWKCVLSQGKAMWCCHELHPLYNNDWFSKPKWFLHQTQLIVFLLGEYIYIYLLHTSPILCWRAPDFRISQ